MDGAIPQWQCSCFTYETLGPTQCYHYNYNIYLKFKKKSLFLFQERLESFLF